MYLNVSDHVQQALDQSQIDLDPYPHILVENILPKEYYQYLLDLRIPDDCLQSLEDVGRVTNYPPGRRFIEIMPNMPILGRDLREFWEETAMFLTTRLTPMITQKFSSHVAKRLGIGTNVDVTSEILYVRDNQGYALSPHSDSPEKILTFLIYLARDSDHKSFGTSVYRPRDPNFTCPGGPLHPFENFERVKTAPYQPNTLFGFVKSDRSFHGVEPINENYTRDLLIYDIRLARSSTNDVTGPRLRLKR